MIYTLENEYLKVKVSSIGATLVSFLDKRTTTDIVLGYDDEQSYLLNSDPHMGATVGRNANRLANGRFTINGVTYQLSLNEPNIALHSSAGDLSFRGYKVKEFNDNLINFELDDLDGSGGFPGNLHLEVFYKLDDNNLLYWFVATCDKDSILNITNHSYFNLSGGIKDILDEELKINTDKVALNIGSMASEKIIDVKDTPFDFTDFKKIGDNLKINHSNLSNGGIDHNYVFETLNDKEVASLRNDKLLLRVYSDLPDMHIYTANYLDLVDGKNSKKYGRYYGVCFECQYYPNSINYDGLLKPIIYKDKEVKHYIKYTVENIK